MAQAQQKENTINEQQLPAQDNGSAMQSNDNSGYYLGLGIGKSSIPFTEVFANHAIVSKDKLTDDEKIRETIFFGYNINSYAAVELGYSLPLEYKKSDELLEGNSKTDYSLTKQSFLVNVIGKYPITSNFFIYGKIVGIVDRYKTEIESTDSNTHETGAFDALKFSYGAGVDYAFAKRWHIGLDYDHINQRSIFSNKTDNNESNSIKLPAEDVVSLRVLYQF